MGVGSFPLLQIELQRWIAFFLYKACQSVTEHKWVWTQRMVFQKRARISKRLLLSKNALGHTHCTWSKVLLVPQKELLHPKHLRALVWCVQEFWSSGKASVGGKKGKGFHDLWIYPLFLITAMQFVLWYCMQSIVFKKILQWIPTFWLLLTTEAN